MPPIDPITKAHAALSVAVNGVFIPVPAVVERLQKFCRPLVFYNEGHDHDISFSGSCLLVRHRGRNLLLSTRHQLTNAERTSNEIIIVVDGNDGRRVGINPNEVSQAVLDPSCDAAYSDLADLLIAEYSTRRPERPIEAHFLSYDLTTAADLQTVDPSAIDAIFSIGYPTVDTSYEPEFDDDWCLVGVDVVSRWWKLYLKLAVATEWDAPGLIPLDPAASKNLLPTDLDGLSGAPVFFIHGIGARKPELGFAGIIVRGNKRGRVNIIAAAQIRQFLALHHGR
ncbi:hypothetical protein AYR46_20140 [Sphingobium yanoikuyae]|uniref:hypothetical protein n=1 Tax=Sphingobium yanoikuyae TaxID=13690 RepID=UPI0007A7405F|nr:hypothetical protein [Sphingobium yanoikuyae]KZC75984.1 hypothetical protein AYR46_20140 [Sphingobium yanoikuyae]